MRYLFLLLFSFSSLAAVQMEFIIPKNEVKQGSREKVTLRLNAESMQMLSLKKLSGTSLADSIYLYNVKGLSKKPGEDFFEAKARIIFVKIPATNSLIDKSFGQEILVHWNEVKIIPTEESKNLLFGSFEVPAKKDYTIWGVYLGSLFLLGLLIAWIWRKFDEKNKVKETRKKLKSELFGAGSYEEVVQIWKNKFNYLEEFPGIKKSLDDFEKVLFKHQFKPFQSEEEKALVMDAYRDFVKAVQGGVSGI